MKYQTVRVLLTWSDSLHRRLPFGADDYVSGLSKKVLTHHLQSAKTSVSKETAQVIDDLCALPNWKVKEMPELLNGIAAELEES